ncbi:MAG: DUF1501 domain-containing protein [Planctomycetes bacterium]|nr:DUF1501 domain-containing protein [Planctomycetota bacterium]
MFSLLDAPTRLCDGISRREWIRVGGLSTLGLTLPTLLAANAKAATESTAKSFGRAKNVLFLWLQGGPPQHETFDPKPEAPAEIRGEFKPIQTNIPGIQFCELLPRTAAIADKIAVVRSLCTDSDLHDASGYWVLTGYKYTGQQSRTISPTDWPYLGSVIRMLKPSETLPAYTSVWLPDVMRLNDNVTPAGQTAGFLAKRWEPARLVCDPSSANFKVEGLTPPPDVSSVRLAARQSLRDQLEGHFDKIERSSALQDYDRVSQEAFGLLTSGKARTAFDIDREPQRLRERYGLNKWGQSLILGRRLIEAGARLVHVNWPREGGDEAVNNPMWDTHAQNADRLQDVLCPMFDIGYTALIEDMDRRGLLKETLVVAVGEFGRTPKINAQGGRDHWGHVFNVVLAGAGISGGQVYGSSDRNGAYPRDGRIEPQDLTATIVHLLGIGHHAMFPDATGRPLHVTKGEPIAALLGDSAATTERVPSTGTLALVPPYSKDQLLNRNFDDEIPLVAIGTTKRLKGWQAAPMAEAAKGLDFGVRVLDGPQAMPKTGNRHAALGYGLLEPCAAGTLPAGTWALITQEVRSPRAGTYTITAQVSGGGNTEDYREFIKHFRCRLVLFGYTDLTKTPAKRREFESVAIVPEFADKADGYQKVTLTRKLSSQDGGANEIEMGVGMMIVLEKMTPGELAISAGHRAFVRVDDVTIGFVPRPRNDDVTV